MPVKNKAIRSGLLFALSRDFLALSVLAFFGIGGAFMAAFRCCSDAERLGKFFLTWIAGPGNWITIGETTLPLWAGWALFRLGPTVWEVFKLRRRRAHFVRMTSNGIEVAFSNGRSQHLLGSDIGTAWQGSWEEFLQLTSVDFLSTRILGAFFRGQGTWIGMRDGTFIVTEPPAPLEDVARVAGKPIEELNIEELNI